MNKTPTIVEVRWQDHHFVNDEFSREEASSRKVHHITTGGYLVMENKQQLAIAHSWQVDKDDGIRFSEVTFIIKKCIVYRTDKG